MSWRNKPCLGHDVLTELLSAMNVDQRWLVDDEEGFTWWAGDYAQRVWCETGVFHTTGTTHRFHTETELIRGSGRAAQFELALEREMDKTTLNALIFDPAADLYKLHSSIFATEENIEFLKKTCFSAVILQLWEAKTVSEKLRDSLNAVCARTSHPTMGLRPTADPMVDSAPNFFRPMGAQPSRWLGVPEWRQTELAIDRESERFQSDHKTHLTAEFAWHATDQGMIKLEINADEPHPDLGNGLHFTLTVPLMMAPDRVSHMALELNQYERDNWKRSHMLGSWSCHAGQLAFRMFLPNAVYRPELMPAFAVNMSIRSQWVDEYFVELRQKAEAMRASH